MTKTGISEDFNLRTRPEPHNTQYLEAMASYSFVSAKVKGMKVLDAGCAFGYGTAFLGNSASNVTGVDFSAPTISWARRKYRGRNISFILADLQELDLPQASFDAVCLFEVIHQVRDFRKVLLNMSMVVKNNGFLFLTTRNWKKVPENNPGQEHLHCLTRSQWGSILNEFGFKVEEVYGICRPPEVYRIEKELKGLRKFDPWGLRRIVPRKFVSLGVYLVSRIKGIGPPQGLKVRDFKICRDELEKSPGLFLCCRKA
jgi:ubiquinone/menaquinone biosynthesis C-methylase UbiE